MVFNMVKIIKSISINPDLVLDADKLIQNGIIPSFSWLANESIRNELKKLHNGRTYNE